MDDYKPSLLERDISDLHYRLLALERKGRNRRIVAYGLKIVAGGSSLVIALGVVPNLHQALGAAAVIAVFIDTVFANHARLLGEIRAGYAARKQRDKSSRDYNRDLDPLIKMMRDNPPESQAYKDAVAAKDTLQRDVHKKLQKAVASVEDALARLDLNALKSLALDSEREANEP